MKSAKIDYSRFEEDELIDDGGIDVAFRIRPTPVFYISRHGRFKKCLSRSAAINTLAHFMTQKVFTRANRPSRHPDVKIDRDDKVLWRRGEIREEYWQMQLRCIRRIRRILAKKRDIQKWKIKHDKLVADYQALNKAKPF
ncbi:hypothetical protein [Rouxiella chamberiensis]|uniref:Uncharacterized protein n=1 Tax=Rouxiella chamberiensis TaxID=1513468 RepID=A0ABY7HQI1_9GAMM|nr:hypothetical protein [Rouxiella chamberiensis]WAT01493.1 hypothetical protein O1V66_01525 [Rouxiella chamberiensis]